VVHARPTSVGRFRLQLKGSDAHACLNAAANRHRSSPRFIFTPDRSGTTDSTQPGNQPRKVKQELKKAYVEWIRDHDLILTKAERDAWEKLATDDEREKYIEEIWRRRDPDPDTEENEFKEQFYERVAYANEHFSSGKAGRLTDRGKIYIKFGKPDSIESHPLGGHYERPSYEGGGSTSQDRSLT
jgi:GWxTD domain-containing protein